MNVNDDLMHCSTVNNTERKTKKRESRQTCTSIYDMIARTCAGKGICPANLLRFCFQAWLALVFYNWNKKNNGQPFSVFLTVFLSTLLGLIFLKIILQLPSLSSYSILRVVVVLVRRHQRWPFCELLYIHLVSTVDEERWLSLNLL